MALLPQDPQKQKMILMGIVPVAVAAVFWYLIYTPRGVTATEVEAQVEALQMKNAANQAIVARYGTDLEQRLGIYREHVEQLEQLIPRREDVPGLINQITERAQALGVDLIMLNPDVEEAGQFYGRQTYQLRVIGDYHSVGEYLTAIGALPRIVKPDEVTLAVESDPNDGTAPRLRATFMIETFVMPDPDAPAADSVGANATG